MKFLVFTTDVIPLKGLPTSGTALRTYGFIQGLREAGHTVEISVPRLALDGLKKNVETSSLPASSREELKLLEANCFDPYTQADVLRRMAPDAILCGHWPALCFRVKPEQPIILDLAGPHLLERHYQGMGEHKAATLGKLGNIATADYYIVSGAAQRRYFLSFILRAGVERAEERIITIPMPLDPKLPSRRAVSKGDPRFIFAGVFLPWQDPAWGLEQVGSELSRRNRGKLILIGGKHPNYPISSPRHEQLCTELEQSPRVERHGMLAYDAFVDKLLDADVALDLMAWNLERELAITIRTTTYLWSGVPVIYNNYSDLSKLIAQYNAGWCVAPGDEAALQKVFQEIFDRPELVVEKSFGAQQLARECFSWKSAAEKILTLVGSDASTQRRELDIIVDFPENADLPLTAGKTVEQEFVARVPGLSRVEWKVATHNRTLRSPVRGELYQLSPQKRKVAEVQVNPEALHNNEWVALECAPISGSSGERFLLRLESSSETVDGAISPWATKVSPYPLQVLRYGGRELRHASLCLRTSCDGLSASGGAHE